MITWKNQLRFATHNKDMFHAENTVNRIKELLRYYQLHSVFSKHSVESKMIISRGLNSELTTAYNHLLNGRIDKLRMNDYHHLLGNLGLNLLSYCRHILCGDDASQLKRLHDALIAGDVESAQQLKQRYNARLDVEKYAVLLHFLREYYPLYFVNRKEYESVIVGDTQKLSQLEVMPFLFEMKTLVKIGKLLDYINAYYNRLILHSRISDREEVQRNAYYFDIHYNHCEKNGRRRRNGKAKLHEKKYEVFSERQLENGDCSFAVERCTPDIVLSQPVWINNQPVYWFDAKCTKATNCLYDTKRQYQMYRFTKNYGSGAILALGTADLSIVGINDVVILDCSHYL